MVQRIVRTEYQRDQLIKLLKDRKLPFSVTVAKGEKRSIEQNKLQRLWMNEIAEQLGDRTPEEVRGECKLRFGVPILRAENEDFREKYDRIIKPFPYETKLEMMMEPFDFPVTRIMRISEKHRYLDDVYQFFVGKGLILTRPDLPDVEQYEDEIRSQQGRAA